MAILCEPCRVSVKRDPWTRPPMVLRHVSDATRGGGRRTGLAQGVNDRGEVLVSWDPPPAVPDAPLMTNAWPADRLEFA